MSQQISTETRSWIIADLHKTGKGKMTILAVSEKYHVSTTTIYTIRKQYKELNGCEPVRDRSRRKPDHLTGFCLMCKKLSTDPHDPPVPLYLGKNAPACQACNGTGRYRDEIMKLNREEQP